MNDIWAVP